MPNSPKSRVDPSMSVNKKVTVPVGRLTSRCSHASEGDDTSLVAGSGQRVGSVTLSILGNRVLRKEDPRFLRGEGRYVENQPLAGAASVTFVRSLLAHARIGEVDTSAAAALPGVQVLTAADLDLPPFGPPPFPGINQAMGRPPFAKDVVRFVGDIVAIVVSDDRATGADAAELVLIDYDPLRPSSSRRMRRRTRRCCSLTPERTSRPIPARPSTTRSCSTAAM